MKIQRWLNLLLGVINAPKSGGGHFLPIKEETKYSHHKSIIEVIGDWNYNWKYNIENFETFDPKVQISTSSQNENKGGFSMICAH